MDFSDFVRIHHLMPFQEYCQQSFDFHFFLMYDDLAQLSRKYLLVCIVCIWISLQKHKCVKQRLGVHKSRNVKGQQIATHASSIAARGIFLLTHLIEWALTCTFENKKNLGPFYEMLPKNCLEKWMVKVFLL